MQIKPQKQEVQIKHVSEYIVNEEIKIVSWYSLNYGR